MAMSPLLWLWTQWKRELKFKTFVSNCVHNVCEHKHRMLIFEDYASFVVARDGIEPSTFHFSGGRSYQLSYLAGERILVDSKRQNAPPPKLDTAHFAVEFHCQNQNPKSVNDS